jgi:predicted HNH restriction endonuclease
MKCQKCGGYFYVEDHHILPISVFGKNNETAKLCSNCHTDYHQYLGSDGLKKS